MTEPDPAYNPYAHQHVAEQIGAALRNYAPALAEYRDALLKVGFTRYEALALVVAMQAMMFTPRPKSDDK